MTTTPRRRRRPATAAATIHDVARAAGVSTATVSRALAGNYPVAPGTRERVLEAVQRLDYTANAHARGLTGAAPGPVAVLLADITGPSFAALAQGVEREARAQGRLCLVGTTENDPDRELALIELMREQRAAAVILPGGAHQDPEHVEQLQRYQHLLEATGSRMVLCGRPTPAGAGALTISYDNEDGARRVAQVALDHGHRRFLVLPGQAGFSTADQRMQGYQQALDAFGVPAEDVQTLRYTFSREQTCQAVLAAVDQAGGAPRFTAVLCGTDDMAAGALEALRTRGLHCPTDISVTGYDDVPGARDLNPALTTVRVPYEQMGAAAVRLALGVDPLPTPLHFDTDVVVRDSVAPAPSVGS